ncbi:hypothetical protein GE21DRAFT_5325 [Neurospora crassa]|uniref:Uncharacterized protein n=1 Tax=Neurospora crassa (strain ATCC 24698 / 74-OR23-1A / CBS 708.71 / DSM 1257 / FGSC 987) TaxID=367110 RepID=Q7S022_NEUCR|nr:hypothetical protein NCU04880 [Neurospora crassa OR74A]EAA28641.1 hypothetical protein NCU04880 [Neurospora crassa OR74A]KHE81910.1 hypothetical protein GE21DRAFT_5325 [Neurospora crassa]|eukprot:XP_957877.1 hypothetical protein NCU04880 [Neurospora crassa OR74A]
MGCLRLFRRLSRRSSQEDDALLNSQHRRGPRPYRDHEHKPKHKHTPSEDSSFSTDFVEEEKASYNRGRSRTSHGCAAVPVIRPNVNPARSAYATPEVYRYGGAGPREDDRAPRRPANAEEKEMGVNDAEEQERMDFLQMM